MIAAGTITRIAFFQVDVVSVRPVTFNRRGLGYEVLP
jgi:hypothetical protein